MIEILFYMNSYKFLNYLSDIKKKHLRLNIKSRRRLNIHFNMHFNFIEETKNPRKKLQEFKLML